MHEKRHGTFQLSPRTLLEIVAVVSLANAAAAEDAPNPTGTWKWRLFNQSAQQTLKLRLEGDKLTGSMLRRNNQEAPVEKATYKDGVVSFRVTIISEFDGRKIVSTYTGKVSGDTISGKIEFEHPDR